MDKFDVAVLGGGPGGYTAAIRTAKLGLKTVLIEADTVGGTCLNRGCIPTKALLQCAESYEECKNAGQFGVNVEVGPFDYAKAAQHKNDVVHMMTSGIQSLLKGNGVTYVSGYGRLADAQTIVVNDERIEAENIILATGSVPAVPPIPGIQLENVLTSDALLALKRCPENIIIIGGGVIGMEFATLYASLGIKVTVIEMLPEILGGLDKTICRTMRRMMERKGVDFRMGAKVLEIQPGLVCRCEKDGEVFEVQGEMVLVSVGRSCATKEIGLDTVGIETVRGFITVDDEMRTAVPNIFAIGDITGKVQLAHVAAAQGIVAAHNAAGEHRQMKYNVVPSCVYTYPEIAYVGLSEDAAKAEGFSVRVGTFQSAGNGRCVAKKATQGMVRLVTDSETDRILGCQIMAPCASDMIEEIVVAMETGTTAAQLGDMIHPHPSISEMVGEAAHDVHRLATNKL